MKLRAFALLEISIAIIVFTLLTSSMLPAFKTLLIAKKNNITDKNIEIVLKSIGLFVNQHGRLPYPADYDGVEYVHPENEMSWFNNPEKYRSGIVPYKTLGLDRRYVLDGYGSFLSYHVNTVLCGRNKVESLPLNDDRIYTDCYSLQQSSYSAVRSYMYEGIEIPEETDVKAWDLVHLCTQSKIYIDNEKNNNYILLESETLHKNTDGFWIEEGEEKRLIFGEPGSKFTLWHTIEDCVALILISHGALKYGVWNGKKVPDTASNAKKENARNSQYFYTKTKDKSLFDDKVIWFTRFNFAVLYCNYSIITQQIYNINYDQKKTNTTNPIYPRRKIKY